MRVLFTTTYYSPYISGLTVYVSRLGIELAKKGYQVDVLTSQHEKSLPIGETICNINIKRVPYLWKISKGFIMPTYIWQAFKAVRDCDVVILNLPQFESFVPAFFGKILGKKVFCVYNCEVYLPQGVVNGLVEKILLGATWLSIKLVDKIMAYTKDYADHCRLLPKVIDKVIYVYPPIPLPKKNKNFGKDLEKLVLKKKYIIGVAARLAAEKGIEYLLEAIPFLEEKLGKDFLIVFAGPKDPVGEEKYWQKITPLLERYKNYLIFLGTLSEDKMGAFYSSLDILVLPSINSTEAFGMVQVEAMLCGVPVVATDLPGVRVPIQMTGMGEIVPLKNTQQLANKIAKILLNKKGYIRSKEAIGQIFNIDKTIKSYDYLLQKGE